MKNRHETKSYQEALLDRDLSWLLFNERIQDEALPGANPLLERAKFLSITGSNMDEFLQVRYHSAYEKRGKKAGKKYYEKLNQRGFEQGMRQYLLYQKLLKELYLNGIFLFPAFPWNETLLESEKKLFETEVLPSLQVTNFTGKLAQKQLYLLVKLLKNKTKPYRLVALPASLPRLFDLTGEGRYIIRLEDMVRRHLDSLFPRAVIEDTSVFRVIRNQDFPVEEYEEADILPAVKDMLKARETGAVMCVQAEASMSDEMVSLLMSRFRVEEERVFLAPGPLDFNKYLMGLYNLLPRPDLKYEAAIPLEKEELLGEDIFERMREKDTLLFHPYHSFRPVINLLERAARDPAVKRVCMVLYRISKNSPVAAALMEAAQNGKEVFVLMEAHARFDEENNLYWGEKLEAAGCKVCYGIPNMKIHSKITLVEREEEDGLRRYLHLGTGNYNDSTAKLYTDFGLLTADPQLGEDAALFFTQFGGEQVSLEELCQAPNQLYPKLLELIDSECARAAEGQSAHILAKMNSINDEGIIEKLIEAAQAGVKVDLLVRGICCVKPKVKGLTENLRVRSIVGRNLEHARAFIFENGGNHLVFLSSADWMVRNLHKRIELMFPIKDESCRRAVENCLRLQWNDTDKCRRVKKDGSYHLKNRGGINSQEIMVKNIEGVFDGSDPAFQKIKPLFAPPKEKITETQESESIEYHEGMEEIHP